MISGATPHRGGRENTYQGLQTQSGGLVGGHNHRRAGAVVNARGIAGGDGAVLHKRGAQLGQLLHSGMAGVLIGVHHHGALAGLDFNGDNLLLEPAGGDGIGGPLLAQAGVLILLCPGDMPALRHVFGGAA